MMFWSPDHGQLFEDWVLILLLACSTVTFFLVHHALEVEEPLDEAEDMLEESHTLRRSTRSERTYRETCLMIDAELCRPAMHAAIRGWNGRLLVHRRHLERVRIFAYVALLLFIPLMVEMIVFATWKGEVFREWLFYGSLTYQAIFAAAAGNYTNMLWEEVASCGIFLVGMHPLPRHCWKLFVTLMAYLLRDFLFLFILVVGAKMWLPGLGMAALLWEAPMVPLLYREACMATNRPAWWMLENASPLWRFAVVLLICVRLPLIVLLVITAVYLETPSDSSAVVLGIRLSFHVAAGLLVLGGMLHLVVLWQQYRADSQWIKQAKALGWPAAAKNGTRNPQQEGDEGEGMQPKKSLFSCCATPKTTRKSQRNSRRDLLDAKESKAKDVTEALPVCTLQQLPEVPKEQNVAEMQTVTVLSAPVGSQI
mmetsp:Transcript_3322/g.7752  ORF Transcript_3322/g.7752 Transcript_3322/m.7752 type:complete len:424 (+) Transcript_3322:89-1360(+)